MEATELERPLGLSLSEGLGGTVGMTTMQCDCPKCAAMCANSTCLPTPSEARDLIRAGYGQRLATYRFWPDPKRMAFVGPAPRGQEGARNLMHTRGGCTFFDGAHCELHSKGLKPLEGRLAHHTRPWEPIRLHMLTHWKGRQFQSVEAMLARMAVVTPNVRANLETTE